jgi:hypothetical protein
MFNSLKIVTSITLCLLITSCETLDLNKLMNQGSGGLSLGTITAGLKEALEVGTSNAVKDVTGPQGFAKDAAKRILIPDDIKVVEDKLRAFKMGFVVDEFTNKMNLAAEKAASNATPVFVKAIKQMSFEDAKKILNGGDSAATDYFKAKTGPELRQMFNPVIKDAMNEYGVVDMYDNMISKYNGVALFSKKIDFKIEDYVTDKTLDGLFSALAEQEKDIRTDPVARTSELLKEVFGK